MLDALFEVETGTQKLIALVTEAMRAYHEAGGLPERPMEFSWGRVPDPEPDRAKRESAIEERAAMWERVGPEHARWSRRQDRIYFAVQDWRAALDAARELVPAVTPWTDRQDLPEIERWSAKFRRELSELGGVVHRVMIGDLPFLEEGTIRGFEVGLERMSSRSADLKDIGPGPAPAPASAPAAVVAPRPDLDHFLHNFQTCHDMLAEVIKKRPLEEPPPTPAMVAEFHDKESLTYMYQSPREDAVQRFYEEVRPAMAQWLERSILEARDRAGGAAGQIVEMLLRGMDVVDQMAEAAARVRSIWDKQWGEVDAAHQEVRRKLSELRPLVAVPRPSAAPAAGIPPAHSAASGAPQGDQGVALPAALRDQLGRLQRRFDACHARGLRLTLLVSRRWGIISKEQWPPSWQRLNENAGSTGVESYRCSFDDGGTDSREEFEALADQATRIMTTAPDLRLLGRLGHWLHTIIALPHTRWTVALAEAAADGACHPIVASRRVVARDPVKGWRQELPWDRSERERELERHPHWRPAADAMELLPDAYFITPVGDAFVASAEAIGAVLRGANSSPGGGGSAGAPDGSGGEGGAAAAQAPAEPGKDLSPDEPTPGDVHVAVLRYLRQRAVRCNRAEIVSGVTKFGRDAVYNAVADLHIWRLVDAPRRKRSVALLDRGREWLSAYEKRGQ